MGTRLSTAGDRRTIVCNIRGSIRRPAEALRRGGGHLALRESDGIAREDVADLRG